MLSPNEINRTIAGKPWDDMSQAQMVVYQAIAAAQDAATRREVWGEAHKQLALCRSNLAGYLLEHDADGSDAIASVKHIMSVLEEREGEFYSNAHPLAAEFRRRAEGVKDD